MKYRDVEEDMHRLNEQLVEMSGIISVEEVDEREVVAKELAYLVENPVAGVEIWLKDSSDNRIWTALVNS